MTIFTVDRHGRPGMPTFNIRKVRRLLKEGRAEIFRRRPFTVRLLYAESLSVQYGGEVLVVHGTHARRNKKTGKVDTNVEFTHPAKDGRKSVGLKKVTVVRARYINAWEPVT